MANPIQQQPEEQPYGAKEQAVEQGEAVAAAEAEQVQPDQVMQEALGEDETNPTAETPMVEPEERIPVNNLLRLPPGVLFNAQPKGNLPIQQQANLGPLWDILASSPTAPDVVKQLAKLYRLGG